MEHYNGTLAQFLAENEEIGRYIIDDLEYYIRHMLLDEIRDEHVDKWKSLDVLYHLPRVERLFKEVVIRGRHYHVSLHPIHPVENAADCLMHFHPWNYACKIIHGGYEMGTGYGSPFEAAPTDICIEYKSKGSIYRFPSPWWWHYVCPKGDISWSITLTQSPPFPKNFIPQQQYDLSANRQIEKARKLWILENVRNYIQEP